MRNLVILAAIASAASLAVSPASAQTTRFTITGTGSGSFAGTSFTNSSYVLAYSTDGRSNVPTSTTFTLGNGPAVTLNIDTAFGTTFGNFYLQNLSSRFKNDFFDFTLPDPNLDIYAPFPTVTGTNVTALGSFRDIPTTGGVLTLSSSSAVRFGGAPAAVVAAVPEPATWAMMIGGFGFVGFAMRGRRSRVRSVRMA